MSNQFRDQQEVGTHIWVGPRQEHLKLKITPKTMIQNTPATAVDKTQYRDFSSKNIFILVCSALVISRANHIITRGDNTIFTTQFCIYFNIKKKTQTCNTRGLSFYYLGTKKSSVNTATTCMPNTLTSWYKVLLLQVGRYVRHKLNLQVVFLASNTTILLGHFTTREFQV